MTAVVRKYTKVVYGAIAIFIFGLVPCPAEGQVLAKKKLLRENYSEWGTLQFLGMSDSGMWVSYRMNYDNGNDTLFVKKIDQSSHYVFPKANGAFYRNSFCSLQADGILKITNVEDGTNSEIANVLEYKILNGTIVILLKNCDGGRRLQIWDEKNQRVNVDNVISYAVNVKANAIAYTKTTGASHSIYLMTLSKKWTSTEIAASKNSIANITWAENGKGIVFYETSIKNDISTICYYRIGSNQLFLFDSDGSTTFPKNHHLDMEQGLEVTVSDDGKMIFFGIERKNVIQSDSLKNEVVEIWSSNDTWLYPVKKHINDWAYYPKLAVWWPDSGKFREINSESKHWIMLTGDKKHAVIADPGQYGPQYNLVADMDYYLVDVATGFSQLIIAKIPGETMNTAVSADGKYFSYYKDENWWLYDIGKNAHRNLTGYLNLSWDASESDSGNSKSVYGHAGWTEDGKAMIVYDAFDIWAFSMNKPLGKRLTKGREINTRFTLHKSAVETTLANYSGRGSSTCLLSGTAILNAFDFGDAASGYWLLDQKLGASVLAHRNSGIDNLQLSGDKTSTVFIEQNFETPPKLIFRKGLDENVVFSSNPQHEAYSWGHSKMMRFDNNKGQKLNAALFYPADYVAGKKYPMVVYIYEKVSQNIHQYVNPSMNNNSGFNVSNLTSKGYLVLMPDITYEKGNPGLSALECVSAAVNHVIDMGVADSEKIGLAGHSFGGYETNYIITQTNLFAAAMSGSGISDLVSGYFTVGKMTTIPDMWRYENQQFRMGSSFFDDKLAYRNNSPIEFANQITTPLLLWTGGADNVVNPDQTTAFYLAMRRLKKKNILLVYPEMQHIPDNENQSHDLTKRLESWFGYYLKGEEPENWIRKGLMVD